LSIVAAVAEIEVIRLTSSRQVRLFEKRTRAADQAAAAGEPVRDAQPSIYKTAASAATDQVSP
jgi:hypothetical protein